MQKKIIALAIAAAFAAPVVALADTANVVIYGNINMSADSVTGNVAGSNAAGVPNTPVDEKRERISSNNTYLGFKGAEDLGDGVSAVWQYETAISFDKQSPDTVAAPTASDGAQTRRNTFAGLSSKALGTLTLGLQDTPVKTSTGPLDVFSNTLADYRAVFASSAAAAAPVPAYSSSKRAENSAMYVSPSLGGVTVKAMYAAQNEAGNGSIENPSFYSGSVSYNADGIYAVVASEIAKTSAISVANGVTPAAAGSDLTYVQTTRLGLGYTMGDATLGVAYEKNKNSTTANNASFTNQNGDFVDANAYYLSAKFKMGNDSLMAAYTKRSDNIANTVEHDGATQWTLGVDHAMSKRTSVYALYSSVHNDLNGTYSLGGGATGIATVPSLAGGNASGLSLGLNHKF